MDSARQSIAHKIKALLSKTVENGATEQEAMAAISMAMKLMDKYQVTMTELEVKEEGFTKVTIHMRSNYHRWFCHGTINAINSLSNTKTLLHKAHGAGGTYDAPFSIYGFGQDVVFGEWVYNSLCELIMRASKDYARENKHMGSENNLRKAFIFGAAARISSRMYKEIREREDEHKKMSDSRALVVVDRKALVEQKIKEMFPKLRNSASQQAKNLSGEAFQAGQEKGQQASWSKPISNKPNYNTKQIGN
jgi:metal-responsive CopG/Arc/MetJ family transcriptional regulator